MIAAHDLVVSLVPYVHHAKIIRLAVQGGTHVVTTSYISAAIGALDDAAAEAGITVLNEVGVDPGVDHLYAVKAIHEIHEKGGKVSWIPFLFLASNLLDLFIGNMTSRLLANTYGRALDLVFF